MAKGDTNETIALDRAGNLRTDLATAAGASRVGTASGGTVQSAIEVANTPAALIASSAPLAEGSTIRTADGFVYVVAAAIATDHDLVTAGGVKLYYRPGPGAVNALAFGALGDDVADNTAALQAALDFAGKDDAGIRGVYLPAGVYRTRTIYMPLGVRLFGDGSSSVTTVNSTTKLVQNGLGDVIRFKAYHSGANRFWWGEIDHLAIWGDNAQRSGWGINFKDAAGDNVIPQDGNFLHHLTIRRCYEGGVNVPSGAFPMCIADCQLLFNNGPGIKLMRETTFQSIHFLNISGDGNNEGLISLNHLNDGFGSILITNLKSEARVNSDYGDVECQNHPIVVTSCNDLPIVINGATHTSAIPDLVADPGGAICKKPGDLIQVNSGGTPPVVAWAGLATRVRGTDTGADPGIVGGTVGPTVASATYRQTSGLFNGTYRLFNARIAGSRATASDGDTTPSVAKHNYLLLSNTGATSITALDDGIEGQEVMLVANNGNTTLVNGATMQLAGAANFAMTSNDTCTLAYIASIWREKCRSVN